MVVFVCFFKDKTYAYLYAKNARHIQVTGLYSLLLLRTILIVDVTRQLY